MRNIRYFHDYPRFIFHLDLHICGFVWVSGMWNRREERHLDLLPSGRCRYRRGHGICSPESYHKLSDHILLRKVISYSLRESENLT